jgi:hypothetical protein
MGTIKVAFLICVEEQVQKESIKIFRIEQTGKYDKATSILMAMMELKYVHFVMVLGKKVIRNLK